MANQTYTNTSECDIKDFYVPDENHIKLLRRILSQESGHNFTYKETEEVAYQLIRLYECLAGDKIILPDGSSDDRSR